MKKRIPVLSIVLYTIGALTLQFAFWTISNCYGHISALVEHGKLVIAGNEYDVVEYYLSNSGMYLFFSILFFALARMTQRYVLVRADAFLPARAEKTPEAKGDLDGAEDGANVAFDASDNREEV
ncbi:hypothetical protein LJC34_03495 [Oscillospiraceae bacterium OttesenSCG-928-G22]|nr:hypothetical protein [Oscillospiraceae bacterium OttesenSCG-928-G22]